MLHGLTWTDMVTFTMVTLQIQKEKCIEENFHKFPCITGSDAGVMH